VSQSIPQLFRQAMAGFPSGVTIVTTAASDGTPRGFAASSFCSLSMDPPLVLTCLAKSAQCHDAFMESDAWAIQVAGGHQIDLVARFATKAADKFAGGEFVADSRGVPILPDASTVLSCTAHARYDGGDHTILIGRVDAAVVLDHAPVLYFQSNFHDLDQVAMAGAAG
jgi:flavin reductase ActVB